MVGPEVETVPARMPFRTTLPGRLVTLTPLTPEAHAEDLYAVVSGGPEAEALWHYMSDGPYADFGSFRDAIARKALSADAVFFAVVNKDKRAVGYASLMRIDMPNRCVEVGNILYTPLLQRTAEATEAMYLLAQHVFEDLGYRRYEWKCNALNEPSRRAASRLGFTFEGIFRQHMIIKGRNRDTAWFSMLDGEWPARKAAFERWLAPENFDETGGQVMPLERPGQI